MSGLDGKFVWDISFCPVPTGSGDAASGFTVGGKPDYGAAGDGEDNHKEEEASKEEASKKEKHKRGKEEKEERESALGRAGIVCLVVDQKTGIHHNPKSTRDLDALQAISQYPPRAVAEAVAAAAAQDDLGRAFPSAALRHLLRGQPRPQPQPPAGEGAQGKAVQIPRTTLDMDFSKKTYVGGAI